MRWFVVLLVLAGCGRFGFGTTGGDDGDDGGGGPPQPIEIAAAAFSATSTEFVDVASGTLIIPPSDATTWLVLTSAALSSNGVAAVTVEARYLVDGVERGFGATQMTAGFGPWQHFYVLPGTTEPQTIAYQLRDVSGGTATIDQLHAVAIPLPASADLRYAAVDEPQPITATILSPATQLSLGALAGDYVVLVLVNGTELPDASNINLEWRGPSGEVLVPDSQFPREPWQSLLGARVLSLAASDAVFTLYASTDGTGAQIEYVRALAVPVGAFASVDHEFSSTNINTAAAQPVIATELVPTGDAARFVYLGSTWAEEDCANPIDALRRLHFMIDSEDRVIEHATENCAYQITYGTTDLLQARPSLIGTGVSSGNGQVARLGESQVMLLGLR